VLGGIKNCIHSIEKDYGILKMFFKNLIHYIYPLYMFFILARVYVKNKVFVQITSLTF